MISSENSSGLRHRRRSTWTIVSHLLGRRRRAPRSASSAVQFSTMTIVASAISPMAIARPASENRLIVWPKPTSGSAVNSVPSSRMADRRRPRCGRSSETTAITSDQHDQLDSRASRRTSSSVVPDPGRAIVGGDDLDALPAATAVSCSSFCSERARDRQDVLVLLHDHDAADDFAGAVEVDGAAPLVVADLEVADVLQVDRRARRASRPTTRNSSLSRSSLSIDAAQLVVAVGDLDHASAGFLKHALDRGDHLPERDAAPWPAAAETSSPDTASPARRPTRLRRRRAPSAAPA